MLWQLVGSAALRYLVGLLLAGWASQVTKSGEMLILLAGSIHFCVGASRALNLSPVVTSLAVGATMVNVTDRSRHLVETLSKTDPLGTRFALVQAREAGLATTPCAEVLPADL